MTCQILAKPQRRICMWGKPRCWGSKNRCPNRRTTSMGFPARLSDIIRSFRPLPTCLSHLTIIFRVSASIKVVATTSAIPVGVFLSSAARYTRSFWPCSVCGPSFRILCKDIVVSCSRVNSKRWTYSDAEDPRFAWPSLPMTNKLTAFFSLQDNISEPRKATLQTPSAL